MRIAYMLTSLGRGGAERQVVGIAEHMAARGHDVVIIVLKPAEAHEWATSLEVVRLEVRKSPASIFSALIRARRRLRIFHPDLVHSHTFPANMAARVLHMLGWAPEVLSTIHNVYEGAWLRTALYRLTDGLSIHTTAVSEAVAKRNIETGAIRACKCSVVTNAIDTQNFGSNSRLRNGVRIDLLAKDQFIWLAAGRLSPAKDHPNLLRAFAYLRSAGSSTELWIAGEGSASEKKRLLECADAIGISDSVRWLGLRDDMPAVLEAADAFVLSSAWEGMPLVVGEAMAKEKPVVVTDVGGVSELVGNAGAIVRSKDPKALADAMLCVMRMPEDERRSMGRHARERICQHFDMNRRADEWNALYTGLLRAQRH
jgi:glycosyltransferase involved in cell wall biosynthesis